MNQLRRVLIFLLVLIAAALQVIPAVSAVAADDKIVVVLDPGHGGHDPGALGINYESYYNLQVALAAKAKLEANGNFIVYMTRSTQNEYLTLAQRMYYADSVNADIALSIHFNSGSNPGMSGVEVYTSVLDRFYMGTLSQKIATKASAAAGIPNRGVFRKYDYGSTLYYWSDKYQWDIPGDTSVGGLSDYYGIITWGAKFGFPAIIVEHAYLSNPSDREIIENPDILKAMGEADANALIEYYTKHTHSYGAEMVDAPVTCFSAGKKSVHCTLCGHRKNVSTVAAAPDSTKHIWLLEEGATTATCDSAGYVRYYCRYTHNLNDKGCTQFPVHRTENVTPALGHDYKVTFKRDVTHTVDGITTYTCSRCNGSYNETVPAKGHSYELTSHTDPDCTNAGADVYTCSECKESYSNPIPALGHKFNVLERIDSTCEEKGSEHRICQVCQFDETVDLPKLGHDFVIYSDVMPNCLEEGLRVTKCTVCDKMEEEVKPKADHSFAVISETKPTCTTTGEIKKQCIVCSHEETEIIDALGHDYRLGEKTAPHCTETIYRTAFCSVCGDEGKVETPPVGHSFPDEGVVVRSPGLIFDGEIEYECHCGAKELRTVRDLTIFEYNDVHPLRFTLLCVGAGIVCAVGLIALVIVIRRKRKSGSDDEDEDTESESDLEENPEDSENSDDTDEPDDTDDTDDTDETETSDNESEESEEKVPEAAE